MPHDQCPESHFTLNKLVFYLLKNKGIQKVGKVKTKVNTHLTHPIHLAHLTCLACLAFIALMHFIGLSIIICVNLLPTTYWYTILFQSLLVQYVVANRQGHDTQKYAGCSRCDEGKRNTKYPFYKYLYFVPVKNIRHNCFFNFCEPRSRLIAFVIDTVTVIGILLVVCELSH
jgi:hypothetical protein